MDTASVARSVAFIGTASNLWLSGIFFSSSHLAVPLFYDLPTSISTNAFTTFYYSGAMTVVPLALFSPAASATAAYLNPSCRLGYSLAAGGAIGTLIWTRLVMNDTNLGLIALKEDEARRDKVGAKGVEQMLRRWKWMNMVRSGLAGIGGFVGLAMFGEMWKL